MEALWVTSLGLHHDPGCHNEKCQNSPASQANHFIKSHALAFCMVWRKDLIINRNRFLGVMVCFCSRIGCDVNDAPCSCAKLLPFLFSHTPYCTQRRSWDQIARKSEMPEVSNRAISPTQIYWKGISPFNSMVDKWPVSNLAKIYRVVPTYNDAAKCNYDIMMP